MRAEGKEITQAKRCFALTAAQSRCDFFEAANDIDPAAQPL